MKIFYDGKWPNLCRGTLFIERDNGIKVEYPADNFLSSGGSVFFTDDWDAIVMKGPWIFDWKDDAPFSCEEKREIEEHFDTNVHQGCCGGCV